MLVRDNFDDARIWGVEAWRENCADASFTVNAAFTYVNARDTTTDLPPNIEGGTPAPNAY